MSRVKYTGQTIPVRAGGPSWPIRTGATGTLQGRTLTATDRLPQEEFAEVLIDGFRYPVYLPTADLEVL